MTILIRPFWTTGLAAAARAFMADQAPVQPAELGELLELAHVHLRQQFAWPSDSAIDAAALAAWAQVAARETRAYVDLEASTPHLIWLVDPVAGVRHPFPAADLVRLLGPRAAAG